MVEVRENAGDSCSVNGYIVSGPESSGNRLLAGILIRSGCFGCASTEQPRHYLELLPARFPICIIQHTNLDYWVSGLLSLGYANVYVIIVVREPIATAMSAVGAGHFENFEDAYLSRVHTIADNVIAAKFANVEIVTYEGLSEEFLKVWLPRIGLKHKYGDIVVDGKTTYISNRNSYHYG